MNLFENVEKIRLLKGAIRNCSLEELGPMKEEDVWNWDDSEMCCLGFDLEE